ncbi:MAG: hypothetical protein H7Z12_14125, partial [Rhodospirillaceae bacterium]|nr:hypothetical protein [Rhodospirillales bacterium]
IHIRLGVALLALAAAAPACAEESGSDWLGSVTDFVRDGLGPPRTVEDIRREEQQRVSEGLKAPEPEPKLVAPMPAAIPMPAPEVEPEVVAPVVAAPAPEIKPEPKKAEVKVKPVVVPVAAPAPVMPVPEAKPKPVIVRVPVPLLPPEPLTSRIAATATLDQAVKLGGSAEIYGARIKIPARN